jgi:hypothetical protein
MQAAVSFAKVFVQILVVCQLLGGHTHSVDGSLAAFRDALPTPAPMVAR